MVHGDCLSRDCAFFKAALKREWGPDRAIRIPEETPLLMGYYVEHLYGGPLPTHQLKSGPNVLDPDQPSYELLATLYVLGETMLDRTIAKRSSGNSSDSCATTVSILGRVPRPSASFIKEPRQSPPFIV